MKKKIIIILSAVIASLCAAVVALSVFTETFIPYSQLFAKIYSGNRISAELNIYVDGVAAKITKADDGDYLIEGTEYGAKLLHRANENDSYEYNLLVNSKYKMKISAQHFNWWEIIKSTVYINIDSASASCFLTEKHSFTSDNPKYRVKVGEYNEYFYDLTEGVSFFIGPKG